MTTHASQVDADVIILGGGCAGLSLAGRLARSGSDLTVLVLEARTRYREDRTWCGWRMQPHPYIDCAAASWNRWRIVTSEGGFQRESSLYPYEMIPADRFYDQSCAWIRKSGNVSIRMEADVALVSEGSSDVQIHLANRDVLTATWVIDTRPQVRPSRSPWLWQNFVGYVVQGDATLTERLGLLPILMDFQPSGTSAVQFMYVLPLATHCYLCEWTRFSAERGEEAEIEAQLLVWLESNVGINHSLGRRESGSLPMAPPLQQGTAGSRIVPAGTLGGSMRPSTGYAFHAIQRWADQCHASLIAGGPPIAPRRDRRLDLMDEVFLRVLQDKSSSSAAVLGSLFRATEPEALIRFLSGLPRPRDVWSVVKSLPWLPFIKATLASFRAEGAL